MCKAGIIEFISFGNLKCLPRLLIILSLPLPPKVDGGRLCFHPCLSVWLWAGYLKKLWLDSDEIWWTSWVCDKEELMRFWCLTKKKGRICVQTDQWDRRCRQFSLVEVCALPSTTLVPGVGRLKSILVVEELRALLLFGTIVLQFETTEVWDENDHCLFIYNEETWRLVCHDDSELLMVILTG